ncbi:hypothetical protein D3C71_1184880 [compost metagenome]
MGKTWRPKEDEILLKCIKDSVAAGETIQHGLNVASSKLIDRTKQSCEQRYYVRMDAKQVNTTSKNWEPLEDTILTSAILGNVANGGSESGGIKLAIKQLPGRNFDSGSSHWRRVLLKSSELQTKLEEAKKIAASKQANETTILTQQIDEVQYISTPQNDEKEAAVKFLKVLLDVVENSNNQKEADQLQKELILNKTQKAELTLELQDLRQNYRELSVQYTQILELFQKGNQIIAAR